MCGVDRNARQLKSFMKIKWIKGQPLEAEKESHYSKQEKAWKKREKEIRKEERNTE